LTEPTPEQLKDAMERFGFTEQEARIFVHLNEAERLLDQLTIGETSESDEGSVLGDIIWSETHIHEAFNSLYRRLGVRVLRRRYPEGWGGPRNPEDGDKG
jgi:hypothetical protein